MIELTNSELHTGLLRKAWRHQQTRLVLVTLIAHCPEVDSSNTTDSHKYRVRQRAGSSTYCKNNNSAPVVSVIRFHAEQQHYGCPWAISTLQSPLQQSFVNSSLQLLVFIWFPQCSLCVLYASNFYRAMVVGLLPLLRKYTNQYLQQFFPPEHDVHNVNIKCLLLIESSLRDPHRHFLSSAVVMHNPRLWHGRVTSRHRAWSVTNSDKAWDTAVPQWLHNFSPFLLCSISIILVLNNSTESDFKFFGWKYVKLWVFALQFSIDKS